MILKYFNINVPLIVYFDSLCLCWNSGFVNSLFQDFWIKDFSKSTNLAPYKFRSFSSIVAWCLCAQRAARAVFLLLLLSNCSGAALALLNRLSVQFSNFAVRIHMWICVSGKKKGFLNFKPKKNPSEIKNSFFEQWILRRNCSTRSSHGR